MERWSPRVGVGCNLGEGKKRLEAPDGVKYSMVVFMVAVKMAGRSCLSFLKWSCELLYVVASLSLRYCLIVVSCVIMRIEEREKEKIERNEIWCGI